MSRASLYFSLLIFCSLCLPVSADDPLSIFVSIPPQKYLVERIGQRHVDVQVLLKPGHSPETFEPGPKQLAALASSQLYFRIGVPFESVWIDVIEERNSTLRVVPCCRNIISSQSSELDSHIWMSPKNALVLAQQIKRQLVDFDPAHKREYEANYQALDADLRQLNAEIKHSLGQPRTPYFIITHASLGHYAKDYGLIQLALEEDGRDLGTKSLGKVVMKAKQEGIDVVLVQKQHHAAGAGAIANELGATQIEIDPLLGDYLANLRDLTSIIARAVN